MRVRSSSGSPGTGSEEGIHLLRGERLQEDRGEIPRPAAPRGSSVGELRSRERHDEDRMLAGPLDQVFDEVQERAVRPVDVLEDHHRRSFLGDPLEEDPAGGEEVLLVSGPPLLQSEEVREPRPHETAFRFVPDVLLDRREEFRKGRRRILVLQDPGAAPHHLGESPERDTFPVRQTAALVPPDVVDQPVDVFVQLPDET